MILDNLLGESGYSGLAALLVLLFSLVILTKICACRDPSQKHHSEPSIPSAPYWIPFLRNTIPFLFNSHQYLVKLRQKFGASPIQLLVGGQKIIYLPHSDGTASKMLKSRDLTQTPLIIKHLRDNFGMPEDDLRLYFDTSDSNPSQEDHRALHTMLSGKTLETFIDITATQFIKSIEEKRAQWTDWVELPDLYTFIRDELSRAQMYALCGEEIFNVAPTLMHDFWEFDKQLPDLFKGLPTWMIPKARASRDKMLSHIRAWHTRLQQSPPPPPNTTWHSIHGLRLMISRRTIWHNMSPEGQVVQDLGLIRASISNSTAATIWPILSTLHPTNPTLTPRILSSITPHFTPHTLTFNPQTLPTVPLLNSLYLESLRYSTAVAITRQPKSPTTPTSISPLKSQFRPSTTLLTFTFPAHHDPTFWNEGPLYPNNANQRHHPIDTFFAERFLSYPDEELTGPIQPSHPDPYSIVREHPITHTPAQDSTAKVVTSGLHDYFLPYGGGGTICPGRHFAKQEIMFAVAVVVRGLEMEVLDPGDVEKVRPDERFSLMGNMPPDRGVRVRMRGRGG
ncbi:hypothetical protein ASPCADRAFT_10479 [Aspergillus carbonarius ITEM 5010]|uniref:Cytochrome P450 n=1 Tax=Aspergillus carbonarius (strain ITEM 5010) TaxID=602072 RepID=A0A1R3R7U2_ASPC5|nr:hypothetical protein ASPCADRAFT_10479 [Aspergillus carbonarius ITEM 5010]